MLCPLSSRSIVDSPIRLSSRSHRKRPITPVDCRERGFASAKWTQRLINAAVTGHGPATVKLFWDFVEREEILATSHFLGHVHHELAVTLGSLAQMFSSDDFRLSRFGT